MRVVLFLFCIGSAQQSYGCQADKLYQTLFYKISHNCITSSEETLKTQLNELGYFLDKHVHAWVERQNDILICGKQHGKIAANSSYHVIKAGDESLTLLAYACDLVTCDYRVVELLCKAGADPNFKNQFGLYPASCCLKGLIRLYHRYHNDTVPVDNQLRKLAILYRAAVAAAQDAFVLVSDNENSPPLKRVHPAGDIHTTVVNAHGEIKLSVDHKIKALLTRDIQKWFRDYCQTKKMRNFLIDIAYYSEQESYYDGAAPVNERFPLIS